MSLEVQVEPKTDFLLVKANGTFDPGSAKLFIPEIFSSCGQHKLTNIFIGYSEVQGSSMMVDRYNWADSFRKLYSLYVNLGLQPLGVAFVGDNNLVSESFPIREQITAPYSLELKKNHRHQ